LKTQVSLDLTEAEVAKVVSEEWSKTYSRSIASRVARCNVDMVGEALQHIRTAKIQPGNSWNILAMTSRA
jgi:hypothetical protein